MMAQKLLVLRPRNLRRTSLKHPTLTACLLLLLRGKEVKEKPLSSKKLLKQLMKKTRMQKQNSQGLRRHN